MTGFYRNYKIGQKKFGADFWVSSLRCWSFRSRVEKHSCLRGVLLWICVGGWRTGSMKPAKTCKSVCLNHKITTVQVTNKPWTQQSLVSEVKLFFQTLKKVFLIEKWFFSSWFWKSAYSTLNKCFSWIQAARLRFVTSGTFKATLASHKFGF